MNHDADISDLKHSCLLQCIEDRGYAEVEEAERAFGSVHEVFVQER
jgi:hypothetical protein